MRVLDVAVPLFLVGCAAALVVAAARGRVSTPYDVSRPYLWLMIVVWVLLAGDAALGENRPVFERAWKGAFAVLLALGFGLDRWRRRRARTGGSAPLASYPVPAAPPDDARPSRPDRRPAPPDRPGQVKEPAAPADRPPTTGPVDG
jgi:hypothetical protein